MSTFLILAAAMLIVAVMLIVWPLLRATKTGEAESSAHVWPIIILVAVLIPVGAVEIYRNVSTWQWGMPTGTARASGTDQAHSLEDAARTLEARLQAEPGDVEGWLMLGRTYMVTGRFDDAAAAMKKAVDLTEGQDPGILGQYAEALTVADQGRLVTETGPIFESLLEQNPGDQRALFYGGIYAYEQERYEDARARWEALQGTNPPEAIRPIIEQRLMLVYEKLGVHSPDVSETSPVMAAAQSTPDPDPAPAAAGDDVIQLRVQIADGLGQGKDLSRASLFVFARNSAGVGPPLAVVRRSAGDLPLEMTLSDQNAMTQGTSLADFPEMQLVARVSFSGGPAASTGDLQGIVSFSWDANGNAVDLVIDEVVQ
jgi:cytochrome c-type biogenesis protein CcmH